MASTRKPQQARSQKTVDAIVSAGFIVVKQIGLEGLTTRHIADAAGVGVGSVYEYFENKESIISAMNEKMAEQLIGHFKPKVGELAQLELRALVIALLNELQIFFKANDGLYASYISKQSPKELRTAFRRINALLENIAVRYLIYHPEYATVPRLPMLNYIAIHGGVAVITKHLGEKEPMFSYDDLVEGLADMIEAMMNWQRIGESQKRLAD